MTAVKIARPRMPRIHDARAMRSRDALRQALLKLVAEKPFEEILIKDITAAAGVSYPVFFRQFAKKEDLLEDIAASEVRRLLEYASAVLDPSPDALSSTVMCRYVDEHRALWTALLTAGAASIMRREFIRIARQMASTRERRNPQLPVELASNIVVNGIFEVLAWWLSQPEDYPIENVATILDALVVKPITRRIRLKPV